MDWYAERNAEILAAKEAQVPIYKIAARWNLSPGSIYDICRRLKRWRAYEDKLSARADEIMRKNKEAQCSAKA